MARNHRLPQRGNYDYYELPNYLQRLIDASDALHDASDALDSAERGLRVFEDASDAADREAWRWAQARSLDAWRLYWQTLEHTELVYLAWITERGEEERVPFTDLSHYEPLAQGE